MTEKDGFIAAIADRDNIIKKLIEQLADALGHFDDVDKTEAAINAAQEYLAAPEQSKPVAEVVVQESGRFIINVHLQKPEDEFTLPAGTYQLYMHPAPPLRELSDEEIFSIAIRCNLRDGHDFHDLQDFAQSILAAARSKT